MKKKYLTCLLASATLIVAGCATPRSFYSPIPQPRRTHLRSVAVVAAPYLPTAHYLSYPKGRPPETLDGAKAGAIGGASYGAGTAAAATIAAGPYGLLLFPLLLGTGTIMGAVILRAVPLEQEAELTDVINRAIKDLDVQKAISRHFLSAGTRETPYQFIILEGFEHPALGTKSDYRFLQDRRIDLVVEIGVEKFGFNLGKEKEPLVSLFMMSHIRAIELSHNSEIFTDTFYYESPQRTLDEWIVNGGTEVEAAFEKAYAQIAETAIEKMFLLYLFKVDPIWSGATYCMLKPFSPEHPRLFSKRPTCPQIDMLQPTLRWEAFPRGKDREADTAGIVEKLSDITYELRLYKGKNGAPDEELYRREGLRNPEHTLEIALEPSTTYFWTVRANFILDGLSQVTKWSHSRIPWPPGFSDPCLDNSIPLYHYYGFITPFQSE